MLLDAATVPDLMRLVSGDGFRALRKIEDAEISITSCLFLALAHQASATDNKSFAKDFSIPFHLAGLRQAVRCLSHDGPQISSKPFGAPAFDLYRICAEADLLSEEWILFYDRFYRSAAGGRNSRALKAVSGVFAEMGDNIVCHSTPTKGQKCFGIAGFHVMGDSAAFCVADYGHGFLTSLKENPRWNGLRTEDDALSAIVYEHATSRTDEETGGGFTHLFENLLDLNGLVILRSGNCTYHLENTKGGQPSLTRRIAGAVPGSSVTVIISRGKGKPAEKSLILT